jgi:predicted transcriptional regulator
MLLLQEGGEFFIEISKELRTPKNNLSQHIKVLTHYGLVYKFCNEIEFDWKYSFYMVSKLSKKSWEIFRIW